jgi:hypothetical protein
MIVEDLDAEQCLREGVIGGQAEVDDADIDEDDDDEEEV